MPQTFPFVRGSGLDLSPGQKLQAAVFNTIDRNAAQAADGLVWSDIAVVKSIQKSAVTPGGIGCHFWDPFAKCWVNGYTSAGNPFAKILHGGGDWIQLAAIPAGTNWSATHSGAANGAGVQILCGGGGTATASKIRQTPDSGVTWTAYNTNASSTESVQCAVWHSGASLFAIGLSSTATTNIETSPDGITWTQRTAPNSNARGSMASNGTIIVCLPSPSLSSNTCVTSTDGAFWSARTLPSTSNWAAVAWNARSGKFMAVGLNAIATSTDGITWTSTGLSSSAFASLVNSITAYGRLWVASGTLANGVQALSVSVDDGVSWAPVCSFANSGVIAVAGDNQIIAIASSVMYATIRGGV